MQAALEARCEPRNRGLGIAQQCEQRDDLGLEASPAQFSNAYGVAPEKLGGQPSTKFVAQAFAGARLVKCFNHLAARVLDQDPAEHGGRRVVFLASDDDAAADEIGALAEKLGFAQIKLGGLSDGGLLVQARGNTVG